MFCPNCGQQIPDNSYFCPVCGTDLNSKAVAAEPAAEKTFYGFAAKIRKQLSSNLFLVMCILMSVATLFSFSVNYSISENGAAMSYGFNFDIIAILVLIGMWIAYSKAKSSDVVMSDSGIKLVSGALTATWVINWIAVGILGLFGVVFAALSPALTSLMGDVAVIETELEAALAEPEFWKQLEPVLEIYESLGITRETFINIMTFVIDNFSIIFMVMGIGMIIGAAVLTLLNVFYYGNLKKFARNLCMSYNTNKETDLRYSTVSTWLLVVGIFVAISAVSTLISFGLAGVRGAAMAALLIVASVWVKKFAEEEAESEEASAEATVE